MKNSNKRPARCISRHDALALLNSGEPCELKLWKLSTGEILVYPRAVCIGAHWRGGTHRVRLEPSGEIRAFRDITLFEINGYEIIR